VPLAADVTEAIERVALPAFWLASLNLLIKLAFLFAAASRSGYGFPSSSSSKIHSGGFGNIMGSDISNSLGFSPPNNRIDTLCASVRCLGDRVAPWLSLPILLLSLSLLLLANSQSLLWSGIDCASACKAARSLGDVTSTAVSTPASAFRPSRPVGPGPDARQEDGTS